MQREGSEIGPGARATVLSHETGFDSAMILLEPARPGNKASLAVKDRVVARFSDGNWYPATIKRLERDGRYRLHWDAPPHDECVQPRENICLKVELAEDNNSPFEILYFVTEAEGDKLEFELNGQQPTQKLSLGAEILVPAGASYALRNLSRTTCARLVAVVPQALQPPSQQAS